MDHLRKAENNNIKHKLELINRANITIDGVEHVASFDEEEISLITNMGILILKGEGLHITQLNLESGGLAVEGLISSMVYEVEKPNRNFKDRGRGIIDRILR
jgi:sporulation protein YabP